MKKLTLFVSIAFVRVVAVASCSKAFEIDQTNLPPDLHGNSLINVGLWPNGQVYIDWQQEVVAGITGTLQAVDLYTLMGDCSFQLYINKGRGWQTDANDYSATLTSNAANPQWSVIGGILNPFSVDVSSANITLTVGETFVIGLMGIETGVEMYATFLEGETGKYAPGRLFLRGSVYTNHGVDLAFRTHMNPIPEPASFGLGVLAVGTLAGWGRGLTKRRTRVAENGFL